MPAARKGRSTARRSARGRRKDFLRLAGMLPARDGGRRQVPDDEDWGRFGELVTVAKRIYNEDLMFVKMTWADRVRVDRALGRALIRAVGSDKD